MSDKYAHLNNHIKAIESRPMSDFDLGVVTGLKLAILYCENRLEMERDKASSCEVISIHSAIEKRRMRKNLQKINP